MLQTLKGLGNIRRWILILVDLTIIFVVYIAMSFILRRSIGSLTISGDFTLGKLLILAACIMFVRLIFSVYDSMWRYANQGSYLKLLFSDAVGGIAFVLLGKFNHTLSLGFYGSVITVLLIFAVTLASRLIYQSAYDYVSRLSDARILKSLFNESGNMSHKINVAIVGAGNVGATLADELRRNPKAHYNPYCFIDNDAGKVGRSVNGIRVYPGNDKIVEKINNMPVQEIIIAIPDASQEDKARLYNLYNQTNCKVKLYDYPLNYKAGKSTNANEKRSLREFSIEDLLFRDTLSVNNRKTKEYYKDKTILVTGGGGSIGAELCRQIAALEPKKLVILDIYENNAYDIQQELIRKYGVYSEKDRTSLNLETIIASVRDEKRLDEIFDEIRPDVVLHAAAHKHVPLMEHNGCEAIKNNVFGTYNVANMAEKYGVKKFVLISTDKAVNPTNIMGASKRLCEMIIQCRKDSATDFAAVRFGNVLGSNGSVIPLFKSQIECGGPVTLTDKRIIRYFMTIAEAVGLVMEAGAMAHNGELFVLDMGKPVKIIDLAESMIRLSGLKPYEDIDIVEVGLRPGEKLFEELLMKSEELDKTDNEKIFIERDKSCSREEIEDKLRILSAAITADEKVDFSDGSELLSQAGYHDAVLNAIKMTVPTYCEPEKINHMVELSEEIAGDNETDTEVMPVESKRRIRLKLKSQNG